MLQNYKLIMIYIIILWFSVYNFNITIVATTFVGRCLATKVFTNMIIDYSQDQNYYGGAREQHYSF